jgi:signal peptidase I
LSQRLPVKPEPTKVPRERHGRNPGHSWPGGCQALSSMALFQWSPPNAGVMQPPLTESRSCRNQRETGLGLVRGGPWHQPRPEPTTRSTRGSRSLLREVAGGLVTAIVVSLLMKTVLVQAFFIPSASMGQPFMDARVAPVTGCSSTRRPPTWVAYTAATSWCSATSPAGSPPLPRRLRRKVAYMTRSRSLAWRPRPARATSSSASSASGATPFKGGRIYVNGALLIEPYVFPGNSPTNIDFRVTVPAGKLWVMGDHRSQSTNNRFHLREPGKGFVLVTDVVRRAFVIVWPLDRAGSLG